MFINHLFFGAKQLIHILTEFFDIINLKG